MTFDFKNAPEHLRKEQYARIAKETGDDQFFTKKELAHLPEVLTAGEQVLAFTSGFMDGSTWLITLTDKRIIFLDKGILYGLKQTAIDIDKVNSISGQTGLILGKIIIEDGAASRAIDNVAKKSVVAFTNKARDAIESRKRATQAAPAQSADDVVSKLERLAALLDRGVLTPEEFAAQKLRILS